MRRRLGALATAKFLGNFNDNAFKSLAMLLVVRKLADPGNQAALIAFASMVFMLPFVSFPTVAGWLADRFSKRRVMIWAKIAELAVVLGGVWSLTLLPNVWPMLIMVFLLALQSTCLSPSFLGLLPELFEERELAKANGTIELVAFLGIILGCGFGAVSGLEGKVPMAVLGTPLLLTSLGGILAAFLVPRGREETGSAPFGWHLLTGYFKDLRSVTVSRPLWLSVVGHALFMAVGSLLLSSLVGYGTQELGATPMQISMLQVGAALGIGLGSFVAGQFSGESVEFGLVPVGAAGMAVFLVDLTIAASFGWALISTAALGFFGGFFDLPLLVCIQESPAPDKRGKVLASTNAIAFFGMFLVSAAMLVLTGGLQEAAPEVLDFWTRVRSNFLTFSFRELYAGAAVFVVLMTAAAVWILPEFLVRLVVGLLTRLVYRVQTHGAANVPRRGPALLIANHVSLVDGLLLTAALRRRLHFAIDADHVRGAWGALIVRWLRLVPLERGNPKALARSLEAARQIVRNGGILVVFPEGELTGNGMMGEFKRGFLRMVPDDLDVPIVPVHLGLVWGSIFSRRHGDIKLRRPERLPYPVTISFGEPLPRDVSPAAARLAVGELAAAAASLRQPGEYCLPELFIRRCRRFARRRVFRDSSGTELMALSALIRALALAEVVRRDIAADEEYVGLLLPNSTVGLTMAMAVLLNDRIPIFLNYTASQEAVDFAVSTCGIRRIYTSRVFCEKLKYPTRDSMVFLEDVAPAIGTAAKLRAAATALFLPAAVARRRWFPRSGADVHRTATVLFSSGSTGRPKGAVLTHHNFISNMVATLRIIGLREDDVLLGILPFFHSFGFMATLCLPVYSGMPVVYHPNPMDAAAVGEIVPRHRCTALFAAPTFLQAYTRRCAPEQLRSLRLIVTGAEKLRPSIADAYEEKFGTKPIEGYGTTELSPVVSVNMPADIRDVGRAVGKPGSIGKPIPGVVARIVDPITGEDLGLDAEGMLWIKGPNVMREYLGDPEKTAAALHDGWYDTGDMARMDAEGCLYITGRLARFSKIGGEMVPHIAIEDALHEILGNSETCAVVTAVDDDRRGERLVVLHLELGLDPADLIAALRERGLPNLWIPKANAFRRVDVIPLLGTGKLDLAGIRRLAAELAD